MKTKPRSVAAGVVIVGAGHAAGALAAALRQCGYAKPVTLIGEEPQAPYQRLPLSKSWLKGDVKPEDLLLRPLTVSAEPKVYEFSRSGRAAISSLPFLRFLCLQRSSSY